MYDFRVCPDCPIAYDAYLSPHIRRAFLTKRSRFLYDIVSCPIHQPVRPVINDLNLPSATGRVFYLYEICSLASEATRSSFIDNFKSFGRN